MQRELKGLQQTAKATIGMTLRQNSVICSLALLLCSSAVGLHAQATASNVGGKCFAIHVRLNGKTVEAPQTITLKSKEHETQLSLEGACFNVPSSVLKEKSVDIFFTVPGNKVYLSAIPTGFFAGSWDIDLADKKFDREVVLPKHTRIREACAVVFHGGEPENALTQTGCRSPLPTNKTKATE